jgi:hypothetical protein
VTSRSGVDECIAVRLDTDPVAGTVLAEPIRRGAGALSVLMRADAVLRIPAESTSLDAGMEVLVERIPGAPGRPMDDDDAAASVSAVPATSATGAVPPHDSRSRRRLAVRA